MLKTAPNKANTSDPSGFNARMNAYCIPAGSLDAKGIAKAAAAAITTTIIDFKVEIATTLRLKLLCLKQF